MGSKFLRNPFPFSLITYYFCAVALLLLRCDVCVCGCGDDKRNKQISNKFKTWCSLIFPLNPSQHVHEKRIAREGETKKMKNN